MFRRLSVDALTFCSRHLEQAVAASSDMSPALQTSSERMCEGHLRYGG